MTTQTTPQKVWLQGVDRLRTVSWSNYGHQCSIWYFYWTLHRVAQFWEFVCTISVEKKISHKMQRRLFMMHLRCHLPFRHNIKFGLWHDYESQIWNPKLFQYWARYIIIIRNYTKMCRLDKTYQWIFQNLVRKDVSSLSDVERKNMNKRLFTGDRMLVVCQD